jgi:hypothetical protein
MRIARAARAVRQQQLEHHAARVLRARRGGRTTMPSRGARMQEAASTRSPSISTMQARQLPSGR